MIRLFDILFSILGILILGPILIIVIILLKFTGEGKVFFLQDRIGKNYKVFKIIKFATMLKDSPNIRTGTITVKNDPRVLPLGKLLRKTKINELPQLFNVIKGDMSLIGPRPLTNKEFFKHSEINQKIISNVLPGLSGVSSIIFVNEEELLFENNRKLYEEKIIHVKGSLETWFVKNKKTSLYFALILFTIISIISSKNKLIYRFYSSIPNFDKNLALSQEKLT